VEFVNDEILKWNFRTSLFLNFKVLINFSNGSISNRPVFEFRKYDRPVFKFIKSVPCTPSCPILARRVLHTHILVLFPSYNVVITCNTLFLYYVVRNSMP
jgi:hypothetical protein